MTRELRRGANEGKGGGRMRNRIGRRIWNKEMKRRTKEWEVAGDRTKGGEEEITDRDYRQTPKKNTLRGKERKGRSGNGKRR